MNPRYPLGPRHHRPSHEQPERQSHARQGPSLPFEDHAGPQTQDANPEGRAFPRSGLPLHTKVCEKSLARTAGFIEHLVALRTVKADARGIDEHLRFHGEAATGLDEETRGIDSTLGEQPLSTVRPTAVGD